VETVLGIRGSGDKFVRRITIRRKCSDGKYQEVGDFTIRSNRVGSGYIHNARIADIGSCV